MYNFIATNIFSYCNRIVSTLEDGITKKANSAPCNKMYFSFQLNIFSFFSRKTSDYLNLNRYKKMEEENIGLLSQQKEYIGDERNTELNRLHKTNILCHYFMNREEEITN